MEIAKRDSRILGIASLLLLLMYVFPLWTIDLEAPQYPEGIGLEIMISTVQGQSKHDLRNINNLNHYIGMKRIEPESIAELKIMPILIGILIAFGLVAAYTRKRWMLYTWAVTFLILALVGLVDFYLWEYDYGHNLDLETAAIKVPGMSYQPPLIGSKQLLNFTAHSWPGIGGWAAFASLTTGLWLMFINVRKGRKTGAAIGTAVALLFVTSGCARGPEPIHYGEDQGANCRMTIVDERFGSEIVTTTGKVYKFDSIECLANYISSGSLSSDQIASVWVTDFNAPGTLIEAETATFVKTNAVHTPMGAGLVAYRVTSDAAPILREPESYSMTWSELLTNADSIAILHR
ncbi:MAG: hypothetical protein HKN43_11980 [Rhodothermales bacterium]|nr:hypothetical protein [Rhodothermales bacterium]